MIIEVFTAHGGGRYWRRLLEEWRQAGHSVREVCAFDDAVYRRTRGRMSQFWLRVQTYLLFPLKVWFRLRLRGDSDQMVRVVITSPFFLPFLVTWPRGRGRRAPIVNILNDLFPDALIHAGMLKARKWPARCLGKMTRFCLQECDATVFLGSRLKTFAEETYGRARIGRIIPVGADSTFVRSDPPAPFPRTEPLRILYSGTMGHMHDVDTLLEVVKRGLPPRVHLAFHSSGVGYARMCRALGDVDRGPISQLSLLGPLSDHAWRETLSHYAVGLVTLKDGAEHVSMPSKTYSALAAGQALLAVCPANSDLAELVRRHRCGWVVTPGKADELASLLAHLAANPEEVHVRCLEAFHAGHSIYDMTSISQQYLQLFGELLMKEGHSTGDAATGRPTPTGRMD